MQPNHSITFPSHFWQSTNFHIFVFIIINILLSYQESIFTIFLVALVFSSWRMLLIPMILKLLSNQLTKLQQPMSSFLSYLSTFVYSFFSNFSDTDGKEVLNALFEKTTRSKAMNMIKSNATIEEIEQLFLFVVQAAKSGQFFYFT